MTRHKSFFNTCPLRAFLSKFPCIILLWIFLAHVQGEDEQLGFLENKLVGSIATDDLKNILDRNWKEPAKEIEIVFQTLPRLVVPYQPVNESSGAQPETIISKILDTAPEINAKIVYTKTNTTSEEDGPQPEEIEVWISYDPQSNNISKDISHIHEAFTQANSKFNGTVTTVLLNYSGQNASVIIQKIEKDISTTSKYFEKNLEYVFNLGIIVDYDHCKKHAEQIRQSMDLKANMVIFKGPELGSFYETPSQEEYDDCRSEYNTTDLKIGFITPWPVSISPERNITLQMNVEDKGNFSWYSDWQKLYNVTLILEAVLTNKTATADRDKTTNITSPIANVSHAWLKQPVSLSKPFVGMSVLNNIVEVIQRENYTIITRLISNMYENTRQIIIGDVSTTAKNYSNIIKSFIRVIAGSRVRTVRNRSASGGVVDVFEDQVSMRVYLSMLISNTSSEASKNEIDNANNIALANNDIYPKTVTGIVLNCERYPVESDIENTTNTKYWRDFIAPSILHAKQVAMEGLEVGIMLPFQFCKHFLAAKQSYQNLEKIGAIVFKRDVTMEEIQLGAKELVGKLATNFQQCKRNAERQENTSPIKVEFRIKPTGWCANSSDIQGLANLVTLWEGMNNFAEREKIQVTMDTAFEDKSRHDGEYCGWWKIIPVPGNLTFENKKSTALSLYEKLLAEFNSQKKEGTTELLLQIVLPITITIIFLSLTASYLIARFRSKYSIGKEEADEFFKGMDVDEKTDEDSPLNDGNKTAHSQPYDKERLEVSKGNFTIDTARSLGSGEFGMVCRGSIKKCKDGDNEKEVEVAVKMMNDRQGNSAQGCGRALRGLMSEIKILSYVGEHKHIIWLEGAYTAELRRGRVYVFLELCQMGSLEKHLRSYEQADAEKDAGKPVIAKQGKRGQSTRRVREEEAGSAINMKRMNVLDDALAADLFQWAKEICSGMEYLATKNVVHADLATRNVLLTANKCAKIADFGLSRRLYDYTNYVKKQQEPMPWRWMAPESLRRLEFNEKTDVWAFGVTMWEIYTLGDQPYPGLSWEINFVNHLERGLRLTEPRFKEEGMFQIMESCWESDANCRPSFFDLSKTLMERKGRHEISPE